MAGREVQTRTDTGEGGPHGRTGTSDHPAKLNAADINWIPYTVDKNDGLKKLGQETGVDWHAIYNKNRDVLHNKPNLHQLPDTTIMVPDSLQRANEQNAPGGPLSGKADGLKGLHDQGSDPAIKTESRTDGSSLYTIDKKHDSLHSLATKFGFQGKDAWEQLYHYGDNEKLLHGKPNLKQGDVSQIQVPNRNKPGEQITAPGAQKPDADPLKESTIAPGHPDYIFSHPSDLREKDGDGHDLHFGDNLNVPDIQKLAQTNPEMARKVFELRNTMRLASQMADRGDSGDPKYGLPGANDLLRKTFDDSYSAMQKSAGQDFGLSQTQEWKYLKEKGLVGMQPRSEAKPVAGETQTAATDLKLDPLAQKSNGQNPDYIFVGRSADKNGDLTYTAAMAKSLKGYDGEPLHYADNLEMDKIAKLPAEDQNMLFQMRTVMRSFATLIKNNGMDRLHQPRKTGDSSDTRSYMEWFTDTAEQFARGHGNQDFGLTKTAEWQYLFADKN